MKKFELTNEFITNRFGTKLFRIRALVEFGDVEAGELGGYVAIRTVCPTGQIRFIKRL